MPQLEQLKQDIVRMIHLSNKLGKYEQMLLTYSNLKDKYNYDEYMCEKIRLKINELHDELIILENKWLKN